MHLPVSARARRAILLCVAAVGLSAPGGADAASVAYVDNGEVWVSSLDGTQKVRLATPVLGSDGQTDKWLDVAQSDSGRIVAVRNVPGRISRFSWFKVWEPDGTSTVEGPLNAPSGWSVYVYPLGFDITANGQHLAYGFSNNSGCCPISFQTGIYVRPATNSVLDPITLTGQRYPSLFGGRIIAASGSTVSVQQASASVYGSAFDPWLDTSGTGLELRGTDIAANGQLAAFEVEQWNGGTQEVGKIGVVAIQGVDAAPAVPAAVDCYLPASGVAHDPSLSMDAKQIAWDDAQGLKVAGTPTTSTDPCVPSAAPVVISATGKHGAIGGADIGVFLPKAPAADPAGGGTPTAAPPGATTPKGPTTPSGSPAPGAPGSAPAVTLPARLTAAALARGLAVTVTVGTAGTVRLTGTVPARLLGRRGKPVVVATGSARATRAGKLTVRLRLNATARRRVKRLKGARLTLRIVQGPRTTTRTLTLR